MRMYPERNHPLERAYPIGKVKLGAHMLAMPSGVLVCARMYVYTPFGQICGHAVIYLIQ